MDQANGALKIEPDLLIQERMQNQQVLAVNSPSSRFDRESRSGLHTKGSPHTKLLMRNNLRGSKEAAATAWQHYKSNPSATSKKTKKSID